MVRKLRIPALFVLALVLLGLWWAPPWKPPDDVAGQRPPPPEPHLLFVTDSPLSIQQIPNTSFQQLTSTAPAPLVANLHLNTAMCGIADVYVSPNSRWVAIEMGCDVNVYTLIVEAATGEIRPLGRDAWMEGFFLNWAPDGNSFLIRAGHLGESDVVLVNVQSGQFEEIGTPPFTYDATFSPDGERILYALSEGLGFGSEVWMMDRDGGNRERVIDAPAHVVAYPRWSPTGDHLAYVLMDDSNVPFTVGTLMLADGDGRHPIPLADADAGHGYPPAWSPDGQRVAFVVRENLADAAADVSAAYLESNVYVAEVATGEVWAATHFEEALTERPVWSPDGKQLACNSDAGGSQEVWVVDVAGGEITQITERNGAHYPVWLGAAETKGEAQ